MGLNAEKNQSHLVGNNLEQSSEVAKQFSDLILADVKFNTRFKLYLPLIYDGSRNAKVTTALFKYLNIAVKSF